MDYFCKPLQGPKPGCQTAHSCIQPFTFLQTHPAQDHAGSIGDVERFLICSTVAGQEMQWFKPTSQCRRSRLQFSAANINICPGMSVCQAPCILMPPIGLASLLLMHAPETQYTCVENFKEKYNLNQILVRSLLMAVCQLQGSASRFTWHHTFHAGEPG